MAVQREILAKSVLTKSGISDYAVNCYVGCLHNCAYCYARYMRKFTGHTEPWGRFLDVKINAPELLEREVARKPRGKVLVFRELNGAARNGVPETQPATQITSTRFRELRSVPEIPKVVKRQDAAPAPLDSPSPAPLRWSREVVGLRVTS